MSAWHRSKGSKTSILFSSVLGDAALGGPYGLTLRLKLAAAWRPKLKDHQKRDLLFVKLQAQLAHAFLVKDGSKPTRECAGARLAVQSRHATVKPKQSLDVFDGDIP
ncbi:hypothetical protein ACS3SW_16885 [Roseobacteraceae bacterium S113]